MEKKTGKDPRLALDVKRMIENRVMMYPYASFVNVNENGVNIMYMGSIYNLPADTVVMAVGTKSDKTLANDLKERNIPFVTIGDCKHVGGNLKYAIWDGAEIGRIL